MSKNVKIAFNFLLDFIVSQLSKCLKFMTIRRDVFSYAIECKYLSEGIEAFYHH